MKKVTRSRISVSYRQSIILQLASLATLVQRWEADGVWPLPPPGPIVADIGPKGTAAAYIVAVARSFQAPCAPSLAAHLHPLPALIMRTHEQANDTVVGAGIAGYLKSADLAQQIPDVAALEEALLTNKRWRLLAQYAQLWSCYRLGPALYDGSSLPTAALDLLLPVLPPARCLRPAAITHLYLSSSPALQLLLVRSPPSLLRNCLLLRSRLVWLIARARFEVEATKSTPVDEIVMWERLVRQAWPSSSDYSSSSPRWTLANPYFVRHGDVRWERLGPTSMLWASWEVAAPPLSSMYYARCASALATSDESPVTIAIATLTALANQPTPAAGASALADWLASSLITPSLLSLFPSSVSSLSAAQLLLSCMPHCVVLPATTEKELEASLAALIALWSTATYWTAPSLRRTWLRVLSSALPAALPIYRAAARNCLYLTSILPALESSMKCDTPLGAVASIATKRLQMASNAHEVASPPAAPSLSPFPLSISAVKRSRDWEADTAWATLKYGPAASTIAVLPPAPPLLFAFPNPSLPSAPPPSAPAPAPPIPVLALTSPSTAAAGIPSKRLTPVRSSSFTRTQQTILPPQLSPPSSPSPAPAPHTPAKVTATFAVPFSANIVSMLRQSPASRAPVRSPHSAISALSLSPNTQVTAPPAKALRTLHASLTASASSLLPFKALATTTPRKRALFEPRQASAAAEEHLGASTGEQDEVILL